MRSMLPSLGPRYFISYLLTKFSLAYRFIFLCGTLFNLAYLYILHKSFVIQLTFGSYLLTLLPGFKLSSMWSSLPIIDKSLISASNAQWCYLGFLGQYQIISKPRSSKQIALTSSWVQRLAGWVFWSNWGSLGILWGAAAGKLLPSCFYGDS